MSTTFDFQMGVNAFTLLDLLRKATEHKGAKLAEGDSHAYTQPIKEYALDDLLMQALAQKGMVRKYSRRHADLFCIGDCNYGNDDSDMAHGNWWRFAYFKDKPTELDLRLRLFAVLEFSQAKRGIILHPMIRATLADPGDRFLNYRMLKALVEIDKDPPLLGLELVASEGRGVMVNWTDLNLGGLRSLSGVFEEFARNRQTVKDLARSLRFFDPVPYPDYRQSGDQLFVTEPAQAMIIDAWKDQLKEFAGSLKD